MHYQREQAQTGTAAAVAAAPRTILEFTPPRAAIGGVPRTVPLTIELLSPRLRDEVIAYKLARNQQLDQFERPWTDADVLIAALTRGAETLHDTTAHIIERRA